MVAGIGPVLPGLSLDLQIAHDGSSRLAPSDAGLPMYQQMPLATSQSPHAVAQALEQAYIAWDVRDVLGDVALCGHVLGCQFQGLASPAAAPECSLPTYLVKATMPEPFQQGGWTARTRDPAAVSEREAAVSPCALHGENHADPPKKPFHLFPLSCLPPTILNLLTLAGSSSAAGRGGSALLFVACSGLGADSHEPLGPGAGGRLWAEVQASRQGGRPGRL
jgi:hypothetical protein